MLPYSNYVDYTIYIYIRPVARIFERVFFFFEGGGGGIKPNFH